ncbi:hypothetical protein NFI96_009760 [Prochilodus magdalenae]|nr:hypothetical protein NFI96_009760 [Prochilodus magdalenae]
MVVGVSWFGTAGVLLAVGSYSSLRGTMNANMYCDILNQSMIPYLQKLGCGAIFQHDNPKHTSKMTTAKETEGKGAGLAKHVFEHLWGILKCKVEDCKVSDIHQLCDDMEEWKRISVAACEALVNSMPKKRFMAVLDNNGGYTKY